MSQPYGFVDHACEGQVAQGSPYTLARCAFSLSFPVSPSCLSGPPSTIYVSNSRFSLSLLFSCTFPDPCVPWGQIPSCSHPSSLESWGLHWALPPPHTNVRVIPSSGPCSREPPLSHSPPGSISCPLVYSPRSCQHDAVCDHTGGSLTPGVPQSQLLWPQPHSSPSLLASCPPGSFLFAHFFVFSDHRRSS